jgi:GAF domain-containing protein
MNYINIVRSLKKTQALNPFATAVDEAKRVAALKAYNIFGTPSEEVFSLYTELAALTFKTPMALITFVDDESVFYKQAYGFSKTGVSVPRYKSPCSVAILNSEISLFRYIIKDPCVMADEKLLAEQGYEFYAGAPLITKDGYSIGMMSVVDHVHRIYSEQELNSLCELADEVMHEVEIRQEFADRKKIHELNLRSARIKERIKSLKEISHSL